MTKKINDLAVGIGIEMDLDMLFQQQSQPVHGGGGHSFGHGRGRLSFQRGTKNLDMGPQHPCVVDHAREYRFVKTRGTAESHVHNSAGMPFMND